MTPSLDKKQRSLMKVMRTNPFFRCVHYSVRLQLQFFRASECDEVMRTNPLFRCVHYSVRLQLQFFRASECQTKNSEDLKSDHLRQLCNLILQQDLNSGHMNIELKLVGIEGGRAVSLFLNGYSNGLWSHVLLQ